MIVIDEKTFNKMPDELKSLFIKRPNPSKDEVLAVFPNTVSGKMTPNNTRHTDGSPNGIYGKFDIEHPLSETIGDSGSAARFFYTAKTSQSERNAGLYGFEHSTDNAKGNGLDRVCEFCGVSQLTPNLCKCKTKSWVTKPKKNIHPTVKPIDLMRYLVRLVTPPNGLCIDPYLGSGTTAIACKLEGFNYIGIEMEEQYFKIAESRIENCEKDNEMIETILANEDVKQVFNIFDFIDTNEAHNGLAGKEERE